MRVLIDTTPLMRTNLTGIGVYVRSLIVGLRAIPGMRVDGAWRWNRAPKRKEIARHIRNGGGPYLPFISDLNLGRYDIYHGPDFKIPATRHYRKVVTVHDLVIYEDGLVDSRFAEQGRAKIELMLRGHRPDAIIAISRFTRDSIVRQFPDLAPITHVVPLGVDNAKVATAAPPDDMPWGDAPYLLYVGSVELRKNLERIVAAFEIAKESAPDLRLVIVGSNGHGGGEIDARIESSPRRSSIHKLGFVPDGTLAALYRGAALFIYPSLYEGFGLPILEAMKNGVPVITSNFGAMAEVAADAALLADSYDPEAIAEAITTLLDDQSKRTALVEAGRRRVLEFTWERCAAETVQVYERIKNSK